MTDLANRIQDAFDNVKADSRLKDATKQLLLQEREKRKSPWRRSWFRLAFAVFAAVLLAGAGYAWVQTPVSYVSIDVNPSIEFALNRFDRVMSVTAYNDEGRDIIEALSLKGKEYTGESRHAMKLIQAAKMLPTPKAQNARGNGQAHGEGGQSLDVSVGGRLNPTWVEWLMGFPLGWTDCSASETQ